MIDIHIGRKLYPSRESPNVWLRIGPVRIPVFGGPLQRQDRFFG
jgi:hypothetical protein